MTQAIESYYLVLADDQEKCEEPVLFFFVGEWREEGNSCYYPYQQLKVKVSLSGLLSVILWIIKKAVSWI